MSEELQKVINYHEVSKHTFNSFAPSPGYLDWESQPDPFRRYQGSKSICLDHPKSGNGPSFDEALIDGNAAIAEFSLESLSRLFYDSLALSAWKSYQGSKWALRVNPSSGNLHPTEGYLISGPIKDLFETPVVCHYLSENHSLEIRTEFPEKVWENLKIGFPDDVIFLGLSSIYWREAWKYGERAFRYCHHDIGHAIGAISIACAGLGWTASLLENITDDQLQTFLGLNQTGHPEEIEDADCLIAIYKRSPTKKTYLLNTDSTKQVENYFRDIDWKGTPNKLSRGHVHWQNLHDIASETKKSILKKSNSKNYITYKSYETIKDNVSLRKIVRQRRSAVAMDGKTTISSQSFFQMFLRTLPNQTNSPFTTLPWEPNVSFGLFVHRVDDLSPGLYFLIRNKSHFKKLHAFSHEKYLWKKPTGCPNDLDLYLLAEENVQQLAMSVSCQQEIASDGCFSLGMITAFDGPITEFGSRFYPRLYWECGLVGQVLYLLAEKYGVRSTGIGCFFDDPVHKVFGINDHSFQSLYHFTIGGAIDDERLTTLPPYQY